MSETNDSTIHLIVNPDVMNVIAASTSIHETAETTDRIYRNYLPVPDDDYIEKRMRGCNNDLEPKTIATVGPDPKTAVRLEYTRIPYAKYITLLKIENVTSNSVVIRAKSIEDLCCRITEQICKHIGKDHYDKLSMMTMTTYRRIVDQEKTNTDAYTIWTNVNHNEIAMLTLIPALMHGLNDHETQATHPEKSDCTLLLIKNGRNLIVNANNVSDLTKATSNAIEQDGDISCRMSTEDNMHVGQFISSIEGHEASKIKTFDDGTNTLYCIFMRNQNA